MYIILKNLVDRHDQLTDVFLFTTIDLKIKCLVMTIWNRNVIQIVFIWSLRKNNSVISTKLVLNNLRY